MLISIVTLMYASSNNLSDQWDARKRAINSTGGWTSTHQVTQKTQGSDGKTTTQYHYVTATDKTDAIEKAKSGQGY